MENLPESSATLDDGNSKLLEETVTILSTDGEQQQTSLYTLIPFTEYSSNNTDSDDDEELKALLKDWGCMSLYNYMHGENVTIDILKIIKVAQVTSLLSNFKHGDRILFEYKLEKWRASIGMPLQPGIELPSTSSEVRCRTPSSPSPSNLSSRGISPTSSPETTQCKSIDLSTILNVKKHGQNIVDYYNKNNKFQTEHRQRLISIIAEYFDENSIPLSLKTSYRLEEEILELFPTEKLEYYRTEKRGKLYTKLHNMKRLYKSLTLQKTSPEKETKKSKKNLIAESDAEACVKSLNMDNLSSDEFDGAWDACTEYRLLQIRKCSSQEEIFKTWPQYKNLNGYRLIDRDFKTLYPQSLTICENWETNFKLIKQFLISNVKDKKVAEIITQIEDRDANKENAVLCLLKSLHSYLFPTRPVVTKSPSTSTSPRQRMIQRFTIKDSQQAFIFEGESVQQIEDHLDFLKTKNTNIQPLILVLSKNDGFVTEDPEFTDVIENITVPAGRNVKLACSVKNLGSYKVAWMHFEQSAILTVHNHVITRNPRISVTHDKHDKHRTWFLHINNVQEEDRGRYMCQINTVTAKTQYGFVKVVVPPNIDDSLTSSDVIVREGDNVTLRCKAKGSPEPSIRWKRDDGNKIVVNKSIEVIDMEGEALELERISRLHMGAYLCIASNGVPPSVSKRIKVSVDFSPMVWIPHQLVGVPMYFNITLECFIEANPTSLNYWTRENDQMITESAKYKTETLPGVPSYKATMRLTITNVQKSDYGSYKCVAKNPRGEMDGTIKLYTSTPPTTIPPPTTTTLQRTTTTTTRFGFNTPTYGDIPTNSIVALDKTGSKYQSNLNEIDKSEQKLTGDNPKGYDWSKDKNSATTTSSLNGLNILHTTMLIIAQLIVIRNFRRYSSCYTLN